MSLILTPENYFSLEANREYMSVSQFKSFVCGCEAKAKAELDGLYVSEPNDGMLFGSYVDAWLEGTLSDFIPKHPEMFNSRTKNEGQLLATFKNVNGVIEAIQSDPLLQQFLTGEKQKIITADLFGVPWKIKMDVYNPEQGFISDLKVMKNLYDKFWDNNYHRYVNFIESFRYNWQLCIYTMVECVSEGRENFLTPYLVALSKEEIPAKKIYTGFLQDIDQTRAIINTYLPRILDIKSGIVQPKMCGKCDYCRSISSANIEDYHEEEKGEKYINE